MAATKQQRIVERLQEIKDSAAQQATDEKSRSMANLAEEAASLGLELAELGKEKK